MAKTILITGSNKGIGFEIARQCANLGFQVVLSGRNKERLIEAQKKLPTKGRDSKTLLMDVGKMESIQSAADEFRKMKLKLDVLVNNAGIGLRNDTSLIENDDSLLDEI